MNSAIIKPSEQLSKLSEKESAQGVIIQHPGGTGSMGLGGLGGGMNKNKKKSLKCPVYGCREECQNDSNLKLHYHKNHADLVRILNSNLGGIRP
jgi:hypothetical protein